MQEVGDNAIAASSATQQDITSRLAALNRWQEEQKRILQERQNNQRLILGMEQRNMYKMLGLLHKDPLDDNEEEEMMSIEMPRHAEFQESDDEPEIQVPTTDLEVAQHQNEPNTRPKRAFLRRGEGLKQRFKVDPDKLRLNNLPRYKFANAHPELRAPQPGRLPKRGILKTTPPQKTSPVSPVSETMPPPTQPPKLRPPPLSLKEQRFQDLLMNAKTTCSSTPDMKSSSSSSNSTISPKVRFVQLQEADHARGQAADDEDDDVEELDPTSEISSSPVSNMCWAKVLDAQQIKPPILHRRTAQICVENDDNISIFELLEQKASEGNIDMNSSCIRAFMARKEQRRQLDESDQIVVTQQLRQMRLQPEVAQIMHRHEDDDETEEVNNEAEDDEKNTTLTPVKLANGKTQVRVRFSDSNDTHEYSDTTETTLQDGTNVQLFEEFKAALFQALEQKKTSAETAPEHPPASKETPILTDELKTKTELVRVRLEELEAEIATFKEQNSQLLKMKQQHELVKAQCAQEHLEAMERVHDEKIQAEIYLHDERMKIEEERRKSEQQMRLQKSNANSKEKKELAALKQQIETLQLQLKQKEQTHVSAQARLRAQLRATEREQRGYQDEIEQLRRENKRLEQELIKLSRENSNKMLQEINRNIAKLAPKVEPARHADENGQRLSKSPAAKTNLDKSEKTPKARICSRRHSSIRNRKPPESPEEESDVSSSSVQQEDVPQAATAAKSKRSSLNSSINVENDLKREIVNADGSKDVWYPNGNLKKISADGMTVRMLYFNKDIKETDIRAGTIKYYYAETNTWHTTYLDGLEILEFPNGQTEHRHKNGTIEVHFPNNTIKIVDPSDTDKLEEWRYADGTHLVQLRNGDKILHLPNGQKEIHTKLNKRREYPDGTVKLVYPDGSQETRYSNGRVRLKDKDGKLIMDTDYAKY